MDVATGRRLRDELDIAARLEFAYKFTYQATFGELGAEHELCWVYLGRSTQPVHANRNEIAAIRYLSPDELRRELEAEPETFTPWFRMEWQRLEEQHAPLLANYLQPDQTA